MNIKLDKLILNEKTCFDYLIDHKENIEYSYYYPTEHLDIHVFYFKDKILNQSIELISYKEKQDNDNLFFNNLPKSVLFLKWNKVVVSSSFSNDLSKGLSFFVVENLNFLQNKVNKCNTLKHSKDFHLIPRYQDFDNFINNRQKYKILMDNL